MSIFLTTLNARYWHSSFGLRYLLANMGELQPQTTMAEFVINDKSVEILAQILQQRPKIVGIGVYIWNVAEVTQLVAELKRVAPDIIVVLGGPEVSYDSEQEPVCQAADYIISGEADLAFPELCRQILEGEAPAEKFIPAPLPQFTQLQLPYDFYTDEDIANRVMYVEASRGCPFTCEFCLSALEIPVRQADLDEFLAAMDGLYQRGARQFKFVDRTFNLNMRISQAILQFFLDRYEPGMFLHFEMIPDRLPESLRELIAQFPAGALQFEIGVQTFNDEVGDLISRRQDNNKLAENFRFLRKETGVHIHADLIIGLPGESIESFGAGFDQLIALDPQEIQVGILKRLKGTPIIRHDDEWEMVYSPHPPYEILCNKLIDFEQLHRLRRFARFWDLVGNSGNFVESRELMWRDVTPFAGFSHFCEWLFAREQRTSGISLIRLTRNVFDYLIEQNLPEEEVALAIWNDYTRGGREDRPGFLKQFDLPNPRIKNRTLSSMPQRQRRHAE